MYRISELAHRVDLSRSTLLYYEKIGLLRGRRRTNGYREYDDSDLQRLRLVQKLQAGGLNLNEVKACLDSRIDRSILRKRLVGLEQEIKEKQKSRDLLAGLLGERPLTEWHTALNAVAPDAHVTWLLAQGFSEKDALRLKWLSKDMNEHDSYMADFMKIFETLERWGPGSADDTLRALSALPQEPARILEIGSGKGVATRVLAEHTEAVITAIDNEPIAIDALNETMATTGLHTRVHGVCASMTDLPFGDGSFDLIWAEGSAYVMGVERALRDWKRLLRGPGMVVLSDMVWLREEPAADAVAFWNDEYPDMQTVAVRQEQIRATGYSIVSDFALSDESWSNYIEPLRKRVAELEDTGNASSAAKDIRTELDIYDRFLGKDFGYRFFVLTTHDQ
jgi:DNA-binding transcriptional MerR regulator/cyclopropane fatty-acyl-phospholipid synthase-like methyltransferase